MKRYVLGLLGLAVLGATSQAGRNMAFGNESGCAQPACCAEPGCDGCCHGCPRCGCKLVPVCHPTREKKQETKHEFSMKCKDLCIPHVTPCRYAGKCGTCGGECGGGDCCNHGCSSGSNEGCCVRQVRKLVIHPVTKEHCVRACYVTWRCAHCGYCGNDGCCEASAAPAAPVPPSIVPPAPKPPAPPKTTKATPRPSEIGLLRTP